MKKLFVSIIMVSLAVWSYAQNDCLSAKISGAHQVEPGITETYTHSFPSTGVENFIWKVEGAAMVDGVEMTQYPNGQVTKKGTSLDIIWDGTPTGRVIVRQEIPCQALTNKPEIDFPITKIPTDPGSGGGSYIPDPKTTCLGLTISPNSWKEYKTYSGISDPTTVELCGYLNLKILNNITANKFYGEFNGIVKGTGGYFSKIQIGSLHPIGTHSNYKLSVDGKIVSKDVVVTIDNWADFVFANDYKLLTLTEVENYIIQNGHLPDVPSENEVKTNGVSLGNMDAILLRKIEELTLYVIELEKKVKELEK